MKHLFLFGLISLLCAMSFVLSSLHPEPTLAWPNRNAGSGCGEPGCHPPGAIVTAEHIGENMIQVEVMGTTADVAGEIVKDDVIIEEKNVAENPFILHVDEDGTYTVNAGLDGWGRWGSTEIDVTLVKVNRLSWGSVKLLFE